MYFQSVNILKSRFVIKDTGQRIEWTGDTERKRKRERKNRTTSWKQLNEWLEQFYQKRIEIENTWNRSRKNSLHTWHDEKNIAKFHDNRCVLGFDSSHPLECILSLALFQSTDLNGCRLLRALHVSTCQISSYFCVLQHTIWTCFYFIFVFHHHLLYSQWVVWLLIFFCSGSSIVVVVQMN